MNVYIFGLALFIALSYLSWPLIGKTMGVNSAWLVTLVMIGTALAVSILSLTRGELVKTAAPHPKALAVIVIAALANGLAAYLSAKICTNPTVPTGIYLATLSILMVISGALLGLFLLKEPLTLIQCIGIAFGVVAVILLK